MAISTSPVTTYASTFFATIFIGFGLNCIVNPVSALSFFELSYPIASSFTADSHLNTTKTIIDSLLIVYGFRDIFMGVAIYAAAYFGKHTDKRVLGWIVAAAGVTAGVDGAVCKYLVGQGEMNHWGYAPILVGLGGIMAAGI